METLKAFALFNHGNPKVKLMSFPSKTGDRPCYQYLELELNGTKVQFSPNELPELTAIVVFCNFCKSLNL